MHKESRPIVLLIVLLLGATPLFANGGAPLQWTVFDDEPARFDRTSGQPAVSIAPGQEVTLPWPSNTWLRLSANGPCPKTWVDHGGGIFQRLELWEAEDSCLAPPHPLNASTRTLRLAAGAEAVSTVVFLGRPAQLPRSLREGKVLLQRNQPRVPAGGDLFDIAKVEAEAVRTAGDSTVRGGGLVAVEALIEAWELAATQAPRQMRPLAAAVRRVARDHLFHRQVLPESSRSLQLHPGEELGHRELTFVEIPGDGLLKYVLPERVAGSRLRWTIERAGDERQTLRVRMEHDGPRAVLQVEPATLSDTATGRAMVDLPVSVDRLTIAGPPGLRVALQYQASRRPHSNAPQAPNDAVEKHRQQLLARVAAFESDLATCQPATETAAWSQRARDLEAEGQAVAAFEHWTRLACHDEPAIRQAAVAGQARTLLTIGQEDLAVDLMRRAFVRDPQSRNQAAARDWLLQRCQQSNDASCAASLWAAAGDRQRAQEILDRQAPEASYTVRTAAGGALLLSPAKNLYSLYYRALPEAPIQVEVEGPARLRIQARPVLTTQQPVDGTVVVDLPSGDQVLTPFESHPPSSALVAASPVSWHPGRKITTTVHVPAGTHQVAIRGTMALLVRLNSEQSLRGDQQQPPSAAVTLARWQNEVRKDPRQRAAAWAAAGSLDAVALTAPGVGDLYNDVMSGGRWERIRIAADSAGTRTLAALATAGSPAYRVHQALFRTAEPPSGERSYHVATAAEPLRLDLVGPGLLRIDELDGQVLRTRVQPLPEGLQKVELTPREGHEEALYRVFQRVPSKSRKTTAKSAGTVAELPPAPLPAARLELTAQTMVPTTSLENSLPLNEIPGPQAVNAQASGSQGTWSFGLRSAQRRDFEGADDLDADRFFEASVWRRQAPRPDGRLRWDARALARSRPDGNESFGVGTGLRFRPNKSGLSLELTANAYGQDLGSGQEHAFSLQGTVRHRHNVNRRLSLEERVSFFARDLSLDTLPAGEIVDQDVFTRYKGQHRHGLKLYETLRFRPWLDSEFWGRLMVSTNEDFDLLSPDYAGGIIGYRQLVGSFWLEGDYRTFHYFADNDRRRDATRDALTLGAILESKSPRSLALGRLEIGVRVRYDFHNGDVSGWLALGAHLDNGRGFQDFWRGAGPFQSLRLRRQ